MHCFQGTSWHSLWPRVSVAAQHNGPRAFNSITTVVTGRSSWTHSGSHSYISRSCRNLCMVVGEMKYSWVLLENKNQMTKYINGEKLTLFRLELQSFQWATPPCFNVQTFWSKCWKPTDITITPAQDCGELGDSSFHRILVYLIDDILHNKWLQGSQLEIAIECRQLLHWPDKHIHPGTFRYQLPYYVHVQRQGSQGSMEILPPWRMGLPVYNGSTVPNQYYGVQAYLMYSNRSLLVIDVQTQPWFVSWEYHALYNVMAVTPGNTCTELHIFTCGC